MTTTVKSRNFRRRGDDEDSNETEVTVSAVTSSTSGRKTAPKALSAKPISSSKPKKLLSFVDDDEDGEAAVLSKPRASSKPKTKVSSSSTLKAAASSHKLTSSKDRLSSNLAVSASNVLPQAGTYTKEALLELQKNTRTLAKPSSAATTSSGDGATNVEPRIILKGSLKPVEEALNENEEEEEDGVETRNSALMGLGGIKNDLKGIPDEETIKKIRAKRERLRQARVAPSDYISLDGGSGVGAVIGGRLSDDDEVINDVDEVASGFGADIFGLRKKDNNVPGPFEIIDTAPKVLGNSRSNYVEDSENINGDGVAEDEDEEDKLWEEEQFRKGLGKRMEDKSNMNRSAVGNAMGSGAATVHNYNHPQQQHQQQRSLAFGPSPSIGGSYGGYYGSDSLPIPQQAEIAMRALRESLDKLKESHSKTVTSLVKADENLSSSLLNITALEKSLSDAGEKFIFMQKLRDFVSVLCQFLQDKAPFIEELEEQMQKLREQRASALIEKRIADNHDEMMEVEAGVRAAKLVFNEHKNSTSMIDTATSAALAASAAVKEQLNLPVKLDEFGRDMNKQKSLDMKRRAEARNKKRAKHRTKRSSLMEVDGMLSKLEGESSTDESDSETAAYETNQELLLLAAGQILSDASEEFSELSLVKEKFEGWKKEYSASYRDAYMVLSVPSIFSPYVRLELLKWDPLHKSTDFFSMTWHSLLFDYGMAEQEGGSGTETTDADCNLVPELVEKVAIPILHHEIVYCWDIFSTQQTEHAVSATSSVISYVQTSSKPLTELLLAIHTRLADAISAHQVPTWSPLLLKAVPNAGYLAAYRFGMSIRLLKSIGMWKDILALSVLEKLALDDLLCGKILPHVQSIASNIHDAVTRTERLVASLDGVWAGPNVIGDHRKKLRPLLDFVLSLGKSLEKKQSSAITESEASGLARRLKKMLVLLNDYDNARHIARTFHLKEAL